MLVSHLSGLIPPLVPTAHVKFLIFTSKSQNRSYSHDAVGTLYFNLISLMSFFFLSFLTLPFPYFIFFILIYLKQALDEHMVFFEEGRF